MEFLSKKGKRGQMAAVLPVVITVIVVAVALVVGNVLLGQLRTINTNSLGNNSNATGAIDNGFALLSTTNGVVVLVVVAILLALALFSFIGGFGGIGGGRGR